MTDIAETPLRLRLILGKYQVIKLDKGLSGFRATVQLPAGVTMTIDCPVNADLRLGDWLTYYTEVPYAKSSETPE